MALRCGGSRRVVLGRHKNVRVGPYTAKGTRVRQVLRTEVFDAGQL